MNQPDDNITQIDTSKVPAVFSTERYGDRAEQSGQTGQPLYPASQEQMNIETDPFNGQVAPFPPVNQGMYVPYGSYTPPPAPPPAPHNPSPMYPTYAQPSQAAPLPPSPSSEEHNAPTIATPSQFYTGAGTMNATVTGNMSPQPRKKRRWSLVVVIVAVLLLLLIPGGVAAFYTFAYPATAVVTITSADKLEQHTFTILEVTGNPNAAQQQVAGARMLTASQSQTQSGTATGQGHTNATTATGTLTMENDSSNYVVTTNVGASLTGKSGVTVITDTSVTLYPGQRGSIQAHASITGSSGNIPAYDVNSSGTLSGVVPYKIYNTAPFTGGKDAGTYTVVQQSDINSVVSSLEPSLQQKAQSVLQGQLQTQEKLVATPNCTAKVSSDKGVGAAVSSFNVTVTETCTAEAYNPVPAQTIAMNMLQSQVTGSLDPRYALAGSVTTTVSQVSVSDAKHNTLSLIIATSGHWDYSFNTAQQQALVKLITGKSAQDARIILIQQTGVSNAIIAISGTFLFWNALPTNVDHITIKVQ